jgi:hypothetical protein
MSTINTNRILGKLEKMIDFRIRREASKKYPIILKEPDSCPATDGTQIFLPRKETRFKSERDNELSVANYTAHEADHIREIEFYFGEEVNGLREQKTNLVQEFHERNYLELKENPALAGWIDNIVKDRRIDAERKEQLPGVKRHYKEVLVTAAEYFRPSIKGMSELDAFREQYLQKSLIGKVVEPIPEKYEKLLEEVVLITSTADSINKDKEVVTNIYNLLKKNFDINQPISRLPSLFGTGNHSQPAPNDKSGGKPSQSQPSQKGYGKEVKPRENREGDGKKTKRMEDGKEKYYKPNKDKKEGEEGDDKKNKKEEASGNDKKENSADFYKKAEKEYGIKIKMVEPDFSEKVLEKERAFREEYAGEIESMKKIFRKLYLKHYGEKRDFQGQELDYSDYMQSELESKVTGIRGNGKYFSAEILNKQRPAWAVLADITPSTEQHGIIDQIRAGLFINGESLKVTDWPIGLFGFSGNYLYVIKDFSDKYGPEVSNKIIKLKREDSGGTYMASPVRTIGSLLRRQKEHPKGITIITDGEDQNISEAKKALKEVYDQKMYPFLIIIGEEFEKYAKELTEDIGLEHYSIIPRDKVYEIPEEMFRLFKTFGIAR